MAVVGLASSSLDALQGTVFLCIRPPLHSIGRTCDPKTRRGLLLAKREKTSANAPLPLLFEASVALEPLSKQAKDLCWNRILIPLLDLSKKLPFQTGKKDVVAFSIWLRESWSRRLLPFRFSKSFLVALAILFLACTAPAGLQSSRTLALTEENLLFLEAWRTIDRAYIDKTFNGQNWFRYREDTLRKEPMSTREQTYTAIRKMLATLDDPFTRFLEPEKFKSLKSGTKGAVTGVGLEVGFEARYDGGLANLVVVAPISGGPADRAGIVPGDVIVFIDGENSQGMGLYEAARRLQGPENSKVELTLHSKDATALRTLTLLREKIVINPVTWHLCQYPTDGMPTQNVGYIRLSTFNQNAAGSVKKAIKELRDAGATAYVLDIRNNSGGLFPAGIEIAKMWLDKGVIVYISDSVGVRDIYETDGDGAISINEPLAVLVNKGTASASEILAGALKDNSRAVILGEPTFGKGKIQSVFELSDGSGLAVTVARYETPAHIDIDKVGITPNHPLPSSFPMDGEQFCQYLAGSSSQHKLLPLFDK